MSAALALLILAALPAAAAAQDPPPPPPPPPVDTLDVDAPPPMPADTPAVAPADTTPPAPFVRFAGPAFHSAGAGVWRWDREALLEATALSVADLLERIPGIDILRTGTYLQPEAARSFGSTSDRIEIVRDGFVIDPLYASAVDLSTIRLAQLAEVIVERRVDMLRIHLRTDEATAVEPYSRVEAALGQPSLNMFRGIFMAPRFAFGPFAASVERLESDGIGSREPADAFEVWAKWGWTSTAYGVQAEIRNHTLNRRPQSPWPLTEERRELVVRGRAAPIDGLVTEAYFGQASVERRIFTSQDTAPRTRPESNQVGGRMEYAGGPLGVRASARTRSHPSLPRLQGELGGSLALGMLEVDAEVTHSAWREGPARRGGRVYGGARPIDGVHLFAEASGGSRGAPFFPQQPPVSEEEDPEPPGEPGDTLPFYGSLSSQRSAVRAGVSVERWGVRGGVAGVRIDMDSVPAFRMPFDSAFSLLPGGDVTGVEAWGSIPIPRTAFFVSGSVVNWTGGTNWAYLPQRSWRAGVGVDASPLPTGNLQIVGRAEAVHRGAFLMPAVDGEAPFDIVGESTGFTASLYIRIIDVHIFGRYDDIGARSTPELPERPPLGPRLYYGVKWSFWN